MRTRYSIVHLSLFLFLLTSTGTIATENDNVSGLRGRRLAEKRDAAGLLGNLILPKNGRVTAVEVAHDAAQTLDVEVSFAEVDVSTQRTISGEISAGGKSRTPASATPVPVTAASGKVHLIFTLDPSLAEGTTYESQQLTLHIDGGAAQTSAGTGAALVDALGGLLGNRGGNSGGANVAAFGGFVYALPKHWSVPVRAENVVVSVTPVPVGVIPASDPSAGAVHVPPKVLRNETLILTAPMAVLVAPAAAVVQPAQPAPMAARVLVQPAAVIVAAPEHVAVAHPPLPATGPPPPAQPATRIVNLSAISVANLGAFKKLPPVSDSQGLPHDLADKGAKGPSSTSVRIFERVAAAAGTQVSSEKLTTIASDLYQDVNPQSGVFYYLPARYNLYWDSDNGYALRMCYGAAAADAQGNVSISARLTSGIDAAELTLLRSLLRAAITPPAVFKELRPLPFSGVPAFSLREDVRQFSIPADKVSIAAISDIAGQVDLSITTDPVTKATIETIVTQGLGLTGTATFTSGGEQSFSRSIPVQVLVSDPHCFGTRYWQRAQTLRNETPFALRLKFLHFLTIGSDGTPTVYSYALNDAEVPAKGQAKIADAPIAAWLDTKSVKSWVEYAVRGDDEGVASARRQWACSADAASATLAIGSLAPFTDVAGTARIVIDVKSKYFSSRGDSEEVKTITLTHDNETQNVAIFLIGRSAEDLNRTGDPLFTYRYRVIRSDGSSFGPGDWAVGQQLELFLGALQVRQLTGAPAPTPSS